MKKQIAIVSLFTLLFSYSCKQEGIESYNDKNYVSFSKNLNDTTTFSFFFYGNAPEVVFPIEVKLIGKKLEKNTEFRVVADVSKTTLKSTLYSIPESFTFGEGQYLDTIYITLKNDADLIENQYKLHLKLADGPEMLSSNSTFANAVLLVSNRADRPSWWTPFRNPDGTYNKISVETNFLGVYTRTKYETYMRATGYIDLGETDSERRIRSLLFKHWLEKQDPKILDEDGNPITVPVNG